jgi:hypothetical protein
MAQFAAVTTTLLGLVIASGVSGRELGEWLSYGLGALTLLAFGCWAELGLRGVRRRWFDLPAGPPVPRWLSLSAKPVRIARHGDAHFTVTSERAAARAGHRWWRS